MTAQRREFLDLPCEAASVTVGRHFVRGLLLQWSMPRLVDDAQLGTSELVANAVCHACTDLRLSVEAADGKVTVAIEDGRPELRRPVQAGSDELAESGRGLHIVAAISHDWGVRASSRGKVIWFSLAAPDTTTQDAHFYSLDDRRVADRAQLGSAAGSFSQIESSI